MRVVVACEGLMRIISGAVTNLILAWMLLENQQRGFSGNCQSSLVFSVSPGACVGELAFTAGIFLSKTLEKVDEVLPTTVPTARKTSVGL